MPTYNESPSEQVVDPVFGLPATKYPVTGGDYDVYKLNDGRLYGLSRCADAMKGYGTLDVDHVRSSIENAWANGSDFPMGVSNGARS